MNEARREKEMEEIKRGLDSDGKEEVRRERWSQRLEKIRVMTEERNKAKVKKSEGLRDIKEK